MQEDIENKSIRFVVSSGKLSFRAIEKGWSLYKQHKNTENAKKAAKAAEKPMGKQLVKDLIGQGQGVSSAEIAKSGLKDFQKIAKKYGVDFAVVKNKTVEPPRYLIFFKAKDADAIDRVMRDYATKQLKKEKQAERPSILQKLKKFKEIVANIPRKEHEKRKEQER